MNRPARTPALRLDGRLENGAILIAHRGDVVLAYQPLQVAAWVVWRLDQRGHTHWGRYFTLADEKAAWADYELRSLTTIEARLQDFAAGGAQ
jgi:hypothetical protein